MKKLVINQQFKFLFNVRLIRNLKTNIPNFFVQPLLNSKLNSQTTSCIFCTAPQLSETKRQTQFFINVTPFINFNINSLTIHNKKDPRGWNWMIDSRKQDFMNEFLTSAIFFYLYKYFPLSAQHTPEWVLIHFRRL